MAPPRRTRSTCVRSEARVAAAAAVASIFGTRCMPGARAHCRRRFAGGREGRALRVDQRTCQATSMFQWSRNIGTANPLRSARSRGQARIPECCRLSCAPRASRAGARRGTCCRTGSGCSPRLLRERRAELDEGETPREASAVAPYSLSGTSASSRPGRCDDTSSLRAPRARRAPRGTPSAIPSIPADHAGDDITVLDDQRTSVIPHLPGGPAWMVAIVLAMHSSIALVPALTLTSLIFPPALVHVTCARP